MVEYRNKKEERARHQERLKVLKKKYQPMLQLKEYGQYLFQVRTVLTSNFQRAHKPYESLGNREKEDERLTPGDCEHSA